MFMVMVFADVRLVAQHAAARRLVEDARQHPRPRYDDVEPLPRRYYDEPDLSPRNANPRTPHTTTRFQDRYDPRAENYPESPSRSYNPPNPNPMSPNININTPTRTRIPITQDWPDNPPRSTPSREQAYTRREEVGMALEEKIKARQAAYRYTLA